jgi:hypothetical protein
LLTRSVGVVRPIILPSHGTGGKVEIQTEHFTLSEPGNRRFSIPPKKTAKGNEVG